MAPAGHAKKKLQFNASIIWGEINSLISFSKQIEVIKIPNLSANHSVVFPMKNNGCFVSRPLLSNSSRRAASAGRSDGSTVPSTSWLPASVCRNTKISGVAFEHRDTLGKALLYSFAHVLKGVIPARANSSARSFCRCSAWPFTHSHVT